MRIRFIINPIAGDLKKGFLPGMARAIIPAETTMEFYYTTRAGDAKRFAKQAAEHNFDIAVSCGGDGTMNEVAQGLMHSNTSLAIIPLGSGNGLARHLRIPLQAKKALQLLITGKKTLIDAVMVNEHISFNVSGVGFDAQVCKAFDSMNKRGFFSYAHAVVRSLRRYKPARYKINSDTGNYTGEAFIISIANSNQYGNGACIAPMANSSDGIAEICILEPFPLWQAPALLAQVFSSQLAASPYYRVIRVSEANISCSTPSHLHIDGEPFIGQHNLQIQVIPQCLSVIIPQE